MTRSRTGPGVTSPAQTVVAVVGMHRSGTSMVARLLNLCGLELGPSDALIPGSPDNRDGHWEHRDFVELNDAVLDALGGGWDAPPEVDEGWELYPELMPLRGQAADLVQRFSSVPAWGWKDPRTSLTIPFWRQLLPALKVLVCLRNPVEVYASLHRRFSASPALVWRLWRRYYEAVLEQTAPGERIVTHYDSYLHDGEAELRRVAAAVGLPLKDGTIADAIAAVDPALRHHVASPEDVLDAVPEDVARLYMDLCAEAGPVFQLALRADAPSNAGASPHSGRYGAALAAIRLEARARALAEREAELDRRASALRREAEELARLREATERHRSAEVATLEAELVGLHERLTALASNLQAEARERRRLERKIAYERSTRTYRYARRLAALARTGTSSAHEQDPATDRSPRE